METFYAEIIKIGSSKGIIIPYNVAKFAGYEIGDKIKILAKKIIKEED